MALSTIPLMVGDGSLQWSDASATPISITVGHAGGGISISGITHSDSEVVEIQSRDGTLVGLRTKKKAQRATFSFELYFEDASDATDPTVLDAIRGQGAWASAVSTSTALGDAMTFDLTLTVTYDSTSHTVKMEDCWFEASITEGEPSTISMSGVCYGPITIS